jgi:hypothetical protein
VDHHRPGRARGPTQHRVAQIIERRITDPTQLPTDMAVLPGDAHEWPAWPAESSQRAASACSDDALDAPVFNPARDGRPGTAADREATNISVDGDSDLAQHWLDNTAHVSG